MAWNLLYLVAITVALPWLIWRSLVQGKYREGLLARWTGRTPWRIGAEPCVWIHAVSVGEVQVAATLAGEFTRQWPHAKLWVSTSTRTGFQLAKTRFPDQHVIFAPLDFSWAIRRALNRIRPDLLVFVELEIWPNWLRLAKQRGIPIAVVNGRLSPNSFHGYRRFRRWLRSTFNRIDLVATQDTIYATRFQQLGVNAERIHVTGSVKFDGAERDRNNARSRQLHEMGRFDPNTKVWLVGSTQGPEESIALSVYSRLRPSHPDLRLILCPRHADRFEEVAELVQASGFPWNRWTDIAAGTTPYPDGILLVNTIGDLRYWWGVAQIAYVGGSLTRRGGQNMIEPAAFGAAVSFGPNTTNFRDIVEQLLAGDAAVVVEDANALLQFVQRCLIEPEYAEALGSRAASIVERHRGATQQTISLLELLAGRRLRVCERTG